jgi:hypothetical protein
MKILIYVFKSKSVGDLALETFSTEFLTLQIGDEIKLYENQGNYILVDVFEKELKGVK